MRYVPPTTETWGPAGGSVGLLVVGRMNLTGKVKELRGKLREIARRFTPSEPGSKHQIFLTRICADEASRT